MKLEIDVFRPADGAVSKFHVTFDGADAYGNMLISLHQCVYAQIAVRRQGLPDVPPVQTGCRKS